MNEGKTFERFCDEIHLVTTNDFDKSIAEIVKKLNKTYYDSDSEQDHLYIVGSIGRGTAIKGVSDVDIIFDLPKEVYYRFCQREGNVQSSLLQEVRNILIERYPNSYISGDGQVVSIQFTSYTIELVPGFKQDDNTFKYPDSNFGGSWKITNPIPEQKASREKSTATLKNYRRMCNMLRAWKNNIGFKFGGLLIDTLVFNYFEKDNTHQFSSFSNYVKFLKDVFAYLGNQDPDQAYWLALGSNQQVYNTDNGRFVKLAKKYLKKLNDTKTEDELEDVFIEIFGITFSKSIINSYGNPSHIRKAPNEEFIDDMFPVDIVESLKIDCEVSQKGYRTFKLRDWLAGKIRWLSKNRKLVFSIISTSVKKPYDIYWKVRNIGPVAKELNMERGQITKGNSSKEERTNFNGRHYVECYIVKNEVCVARNRILVTIDINSKDDLDFLD